MNVLLILSFFLYTISSLKIIRRDQHQHLDDLLARELEKRGLGGKRLNIREQINYQRKNNYELYVTPDGELKHERYNVNEPRQKMKNNEHVRYLINDLEILHGVYPFSGRDVDKVLKETLKPPSLCFMLAGLLINDLNKINIENSPIYGFLINGEKDGLNVKNVLEISVILSNVTVPLGSYFFPNVKIYPYQIPFLVGFYSNKYGYKESKISYLCSLPHFLIDVVHTSSSGLVFNFNGNEISFRELFPATLKHSMEIPSFLPVKREDPHESERSKLLSKLQKYSEEVPYRSVKDAKIEGEGIENPAERILVTKTFSAARDKVKNLFSSSGRSSMDINSIVLYFLALGQNIFPKTKPLSLYRVTMVKIENVQVDSAGFLSSFQVELVVNDNEKSISEGSVHGKKILVPREILRTPSIIYEVPITYGLYINAMGLVYGFGGFYFPLSKALPYNVQSLAAYVQKSDSSTPSTSPSTPPPSTTHGSTPSYRTRSSSYPSTRSSYSPTRSSSAQTPYGSPHIRRYNSAPSYLANSRSSSPNPSSSPSPPS
ncbi:secreted ookinete protein, putative [Plasmodium relictum]|uniref:Secreted ookinete protein, putative n=1 Tax=Plasmodium relictum TaxID=85471 RepID=A0A1J1HCG2_PLARL|nr:secreted ookinete protein, putative [Plasmodium relictum]CRH02991.1 secreted ookinete protein, putative [Plasmodium relictum]